MELAACTEGMAVKAVSRYCSGDFGCDLNPHSKSTGQGKGKVHPRIDHEGPEGQ
jgi:hypothetical protein